MIDNLNYFYLYVENYRGRYDDGYAATFLNYNELVKKLAKINELEYYVVEKIGRSQVELPIYFFELSQSYNNWDDLFKDVFVLCISGLKTSISVR